MPADKMLMFDGVRRFLSNPADRSRLLFQGSFVEYGSVSGGRNGRNQRHTLTVPLTFLSMFHTHSHWHDQMWITKGQVAKILRLKNIRVHVEQLQRELIHDFADSDGLERKAHIVPLTGVADLPKEANLSWLGRLPVGRVKLNWDEFVRFYLSTFGTIFYDVIKCAQDGGNMEHLCRPERTRIVDRTLYITPREHIRDRGSILQIGILAADHELRNEVFRIARFVSGDAQGFRSSAFMPSFPKGTDKLYIQYFDGEEDMKGTTSSMSSYKSIARIRSDYREAKFDQIIADMTGNHYVPFGPPTEEETVQNLVRSFANEELRVSSGAAASKQIVSIPLPWQNFRDGFPGYRQAIVQLSHIDPPTLVPLVLPRTLEKETHTEFTDSKHRADQGLPHLSKSSRVWTDPGPPEKEILPQAEGIEPPIPLFVKPSALSPRLSAFWKAANELGGSEHRAGATAACYQIPSAWGSFAQMRNGKARCFLYTEISTVGGYAYAVEFDKEQRGLATSLGIIAKHDGANMTPQQVIACVKSAVRHISQRERHGKKFVRVQTIWPSAAIYADVCSTSLRHTKDWDKNTDMLVNALEGAAQGLFIYY